jgi:hypothetical protein
MLITILSYYNRNIIASAEAKEGGNGEGK